MQRTVFITKSVPKPKKPNDNSPTKFEDVIVFNDLLTSEVKQKVTDFLTNVFMADSYYNYTIQIPRDYTPYPLSHSCNDEFIQKKQFIPNNFIKSCLNIIDRGLTPKML